MHTKGCGTFLMHASRAPTFVLVNGQHLPASWDGGRLEFALHEGDGLEKLVVLRF